MPRDASGNYTLPEAPFQANTIAQSARVNHNFTDIAAALSDSFSVSLGQPLQGPLNMNGQPIENLGSLTVGGTVSASVSVTVGTNTTAWPTLVINGAAGSDREILGETAGKLRWEIALGDSAAEGTGNAGSNFSIARFADDGTTYLGTPLQISRATGQVTVNGNLSVAGAISSGGTVTAPAATVSGTVTAGALTVSGGTSVAGNISVAGRIYAAGIGVVYQGVGGSNGIAFTWTDAGPGNFGVNVYVDTTWVGRMFLDKSSGAPLTERLDALEARIAALEAGSG